ncbi:head GIN domain-containing protein [soil metagenome]
MKKIGIIIFIIALFIGLIFAKFFAFGQSSARIFNFKDSFSETGSGNVISEKREITDFKSVDVGGAIQVEITAQKEFSVEVQADDNLLPLIKTEVRNGVLRIESEKRINTKNPIIVKISAPNIENLDVSGASKVNLTNLSNENLQIHSSGASKIEISGTTVNFTIDVSGASRIYAENLKAENVSVDASGASNVSVFAQNELKADASGASSISYSGNPTNLEKKTSGASNVKQK